MVKWWDRFWGVVWTVGSLAIAYFTGRWFALNAAPADLGALRYGLIVFSGLFGLLVGALCLSLLIIGITTGLERGFAKLGHPFERPPLTLPEALAGLRSETAPPPVAEPAPVAPVADEPAAVPEKPRPDVTPERVSPAQSR